MTSTTITIRLDVEEKDLISNYAATLGMPATEFMRRTAIERIENELDLEAWKKAKAEFESDPATISAAEIARKYF